MTTYEEAVAKAAEIGREHGESAAAWWEQEAIGGHAAMGSEAHVAHMTLVGLDDGDPMVLDGLPAQWADGYLPTNLADDCDYSEPDLDDYANEADWQTDTEDWAHVVQDLCDAYETAFSEAVEASVRAACEAVLAE